MKRFIICLICVICGLSAQAQKKIYIPEDLRSMDLQADTSKWSFNRSAETVPRPQKQTVGYVRRTTLRSMVSMPSFLMIK